MPSTFHFTLDCSLHIFTAPMTIRRSFTQNSAVYDSPHWSYTWIITYYYYVKLTLFYPLGDCRIGVRNCVAKAFIFHIPYIYILYLLRKEFQDLIGLSEAFGPTLCIYWDCVLLLISDDVMTSHPAITSLPSHVMNHLIILSIVTLLAFPSLSTDKPQQGQENHPSQVQEGPGSKVHFIAVSF